MERHRHARSSHPIAPPTPIRANYSGSKSADAANSLQCAGVRCGTSDYRVRPSGLLAADIQLGLMSMSACGLALHAYILKT